MRASIKRELFPTLKIAVPVVLAELGWMAMGVVDTIMVGPLGPAAISAAGVGTSMHMGFAVFGTGVLLGLDTLVSQAFGRRDIRDCHQWLFDGVLLALMMAVPITGLCALVWLAIPVLGFHGEVRPLLQSYFGIVLMTTPVLLLYAAFRRYLQGMHVVTPIMFALVSANFVNAGANWLLIYGHFGFPAMGVPGAAWATVVSRVYMLGVLAAAVWWYDRQRGRELRSEATADLRHHDGASLWHVERALHVPRITQLLMLGLPAASQVAAEVGVFALASALSGMLDPISSASHQIALNMAGVAFMVPLGVGSAGAVRVGHAVGAGDRDRAAASGWTAIALGTGFMAVSGLAFILMPRALIGLFSSDPAVLRVGTSLLILAAIFQLFDGIQGVITGTLRGLGDTRTPMVVNLLAHWLLGLPISYTLCFVIGWGVYGLWIGLSLGLIVTGVTLAWVWTARIRQYQRAATVMMS